MNGIERTLRDTLAKLENPGAKTRQQLYDTTQSILQRSLEPFLQTRPEMVAERLQGLQDTIVVIEQEYNTEAAIAVGLEEPSFSIPNIVPPAVELSSFSEPKAEEPVQSMNAPLTPEVQPETPVAPEIEVQWPEANVPSPVHDQSIPNVFVEQERAAPAEQNTSSDMPDADVAEELKIDQPADATPVSNKKMDRKQRRVEKREKRRRRGSLLETIAGSIVSVVFVVFLIGGVWLFSNSEYYELFVDWRNDGKTANSEEQIADQNFIPKPLTRDGEQSDNWVEIFGYQDVDNVRGRGEVLVEAIDDGALGGVRITSVNSSEFGEAQVSLDSDKIRSLTSHKFALAFTIFVQQPTQIYIKCFLKDGVETDRRRFQLNGGRNDVMLEMDMRNVASFDPTPYIAVNSDITGEGRSVELHDVRYQIIE